MLVVLALTIALQDPAARPQLRERLASEEILHSFALDPKGTRVLTIEPARGVLTSRDLADGSVTWKSEDMGMKWVELVDGGKSVLCGCVMPVVMEFDPKAGTKRSDIGGPLTQGSVSSFAADPDGHWVWLGMGPGLMRLTPGDVNGWSRRPLEGGGVTALALDDSGGLLAAGCRDGAVRFANSKSGSVDDKKVFSGSAGAITALAFGPKVLVAAAQDGSLRVWTLTGKEKRVLAQSGPAVGALAVLAKPGWVAAGDEKGTIVLWDLDQGTELGRWTVDGGPAVTDLGFAERERVLFAAAGKRLLSLDLTSLK